MSTLYLVDWKLEIRLASRHLEVLEREDGKKSIVRRVPLNTVERVAVVGSARVSTDVLRELMLRNIPIVFATRGGRLLGTLSPLRDGDARIRIKQYEMTGSAWSIRTAGIIIRAKLRNMRRVLQRHGARKSDDERRREVIRQLEDLAERVPLDGQLQEIRGFEGVGTALYFGILAEMLPEGFRFERRERRPPRDPVNSLLSWTYTLVHGELRCAVAAQGLDYCIGCLHAVEYNRPALSLDLLEPFRAPLCDLLVLRLVNLGILRQEHFTREEDGSVRLTEDGMRKYFKHYHEKMERPFKPAGGGQPTSFRMELRRAAQEYAHALRDRTDYQPFLMP